MEEAMKMLSFIEEVLLDGEKFPNGKTDPEERKREITFTVPKIVSTYYSLIKLRKKDPQLFSRIFYLARVIDEPCDQTNLFYYIKDKTLIKKLHDIASKGRKKSLAYPKNAEERIRSAKLFKSGDYTFAAQLRNPKRGCSASICSNCDEPIAFIDYICGICEYELINANDMPTVNEWENMDLSQRLKSLRVGYNEMIADISINGDWRERKSPLNRFKRFK